MIINTHMPALRAGWQRPPDWRPIRHLVNDGAEKIAALFAVMPLVNEAFTNIAVIRIVGNCVVDWGDGVIESYVASEATTIEHQYTSGTIGFYCSRGYEQVIIQVCPEEGGHLSNINFGRKSESLTRYRYVGQYLDIHISGTHFSAIGMYSDGVINGMLEHIYIYQQTTALTTMFKMFMYCTQLQCAELNINTSLVTSVANMFYYCFLLPTVDLSSFDTSNVTDMSFMVYFCTGMRELDLSTFDTSNVTDMSSMFYGDRSLIKLNVQGFNTAQVTNFSNMFGYCVCLPSLDISSFVFTSALNLSQMFRNASTLYELIRPQNMILSSVQDIASMFQDCNTLRVIDFSYDDFSGIINATNWALNTLSLELLRCPQISLSFSIANSKLNAAALNALFGDLEDLSGLASKTVNIAYNPGEFTCDTSIATNKNWVVVKSS